MNQLITDQLIEAYQKEILIKQERLRFTVLYIEASRLKNEIKIIESFISCLQSFRQNEVQNVITAYRDGDVLKHLYEDSKDYFNQTFKQPQP